MIIIKRRYLVIILLIVLVNLFGGISTYAKETYKVVKYNSIFEKSLEDIPEGINKINLIEVNEKFNDYFIYMKEFTNEATLFYGRNSSVNFIANELKRRDIAEVNIISISNSENDAISKNLREALIKEKISLKFELYKSTTEMMMQFAKKKSIEDICVLSSIEMSNKLLVHSLMRDNIFIIPFDDIEEYKNIIEQAYGQTNFSTIYIADENLKDDKNEKYEPKENIVSYTEYIITFLRDEYEFYNGYVGKNKNIEVIDMWNIKDEEVDQIKIELLNCKKVSMLSDIYKIFNNEFEREDLEFLESVYNKLNIDKLNQIEQEKKKVEEEEKRKKDEERKKLEDEKKKAQNIPVIEEIYVINKSENGKCYIYEKPSYNSRMIAYMYGSLTEVKVIEKGQTFTLINGLDYASGRKVKGYVPTNAIKKVMPNNKYSIFVDKSRQRVYIYENDKVIKEFICSTGIGSYDTPSGRFLVGDRGSYFTGPGYICYDWIRINHNYLFHSVLCYPNTKTPIPYEYDRLGSKASHGCIRLKQDDIKWMYDNVPRGTMVVIK